jgi:hypothetical protein
MGTDAHHDKLDELIDDSRATMHKMLDSALWVDDLPPEMRDRDSYCLARAIVTIYGDQHNHAPPSPSMWGQIKKRSYRL